MCLEEGNLTTIVRVSNTRHSQIPAYRALNSRLGMTLGSNARGTSSRCMTPLQESNSGPCRMFRGPWTSTTVLRTSILFRTRAPRESAKIPVVLHSCILKDLTESCLQHERSSDLPLLETSRRANGGRNDGYWTREGGRTQAEINSLDASSVGQKQTEIAYYTGTAYRVRWENVGGSAS